MGYAQRTPQLRIVRDQKKRAAPRVPAPVFVPLLVMLPDVSAFVADNAQAWVVWLMLTQASMMGLCLLALKAPKNYAMRVCWVAAALWYMVQAVDEALAGNLFSDSAAEYIVFLPYCIAITLHIRSHERGQRTT